MEDCPFPEDAFNTSYAILSWWVLSVPIVAASLAKNLGLRRKYRTCEIISHQISQ